MSVVKQVNPYPLRLDPEVGDWYKEQAKLSGRSFNSEVAKILVERRNRILGKQKSA
ncbi:Arc family DNA-binding protein [Erwinia tracheiphila]|uniref:Arc family DNA-binding protein n=1 Tax=Erwinia tracheiphila TaxID=65700 RepID=UPI000AF1CFD3|nr:Arc family DNA-binding protein [Erwinia tracheiphila]UIA88369.1 Arc family DNA-binding protein [Erwinia tracheiphila]UIA96210.1 Arc family DNA-binding protein [Erwinia tracheiphila]